MFIDSGVICVGVAQVRKGSNDGDVGGVCKTFYSWFYKRVSTVFCIFFLIGVHALPFIFENRS